MSSKQANPDIKKDLEFNNSLFVTNRFRLVVESENGNFYSSKYRPVVLSITDTAGNNNAVWNDSTGEWQVTSIKKMGLKRKFSTVWVVIAKRDADLDLHFYEFSTKAAAELKAKDSPWSQIVEVFRPE